MTKNLHKHSQMDAIGTNNLFIFLLFFYLIKLVDTNKLDSINNKKEGVYTYKQFIINCNYLSNE